MLRLPNWPAAVLSLVTLASSVSPVLALDESERPDLKIELLGLPLAATERSVKIRVTNTSVWWANETKLRVETVSPTAGNVKSFDVENLDPGQSATFTYSLASTCDGQTVKAQVTAGKNYAGVPEANLTNNTIEALACPKVSQPESPATKPQNAPALGAPVSPSTTLKPGRPASVAALPPPALGEPVQPSTTVTNKPSAGKAAIQAAIPVHTRPGRHTLEFDPSIMRSLGTDWWGPKFGNSARDMRDTDARSVGFVGWDGRPGQATIFTLHQTAVNFNLAQLLEVQKPVIEAAHLSFVEHEVVWGSDPGRLLDTPGCVAELGIATNDWAGPLSSFATSPGMMFRNKRLTSRFVPHTLTEKEKVGAFRERALDVTDHVKNQLLHPNDVALWFGYVLYGAVEDERHPPASACTSRITGLHLQITYVVPLN